MTTFSAISYAFLFAGFKFFPISSETQLFLLSRLTQFPEIPNAAWTALSCGSALALFIYFRHDWASMTSGLLQVILFRKKPMTLDERLPFFIALSSCPYFAIQFYCGQNLTKLNTLEAPYLLIAGLWACSGLPLYLAYSLNRKSRGMFDWSGPKALLVGLSQAFSILPGWDPLSCTLTASFFLNFKLEAAKKYAFLAIAPQIFGDALQRLKSLALPTSDPSFSWLSFGTALLIAFLVGLLILDYVLKTEENLNLKQFVIWRIFAASSLAGAYLYL